MGAMIHLVIFGPLVLAWAVFATHVKEVYRKRARLQVVFEFVDSFSEAMRRVGGQFEATARRMREAADKTRGVSEHYRGSRVDG